MKKEAIKSGEEERSKGEQRKPAYHTAVKASKGEDTKKENTTYAQRKRRSSPLMIQ